MKGREDKREKREIYLSLFPIRMLKYGSSIAKELKYHKEIEVIG